MRDHLPGEPLERPVRELDREPGRPRPEEEAIAAALENCRRARETASEEVARSEEKLTARLRAIQNDGKET